MKFTAKRDDLLAELVHLQRIASVQVPGDQLVSYVYLEARAGDVALIANNRITSLKTSCVAEVEKPGATAAPAKKLFELVRSMPEGDVVFSADKWPHLAITDGSDDLLFYLLCLEPEAFVMPPELPKKGIEISPDVLRTLIARTSVALPRFSSEYKVHAAHLGVGGPDVVMVATDGHRLAYARQTVPGKNWHPLELLVPTGVIDALGEMLVDQTTYPLEAVVVAATELRLAVTVGHRTLASAIPKDSFPPYQRVLAHESTSHAKVGREALLAAVARAGLLGPRSHCVRLVFGQRGLQIESTSPDAGDVREHVPLADYQGQDISIAFKGHYLADFLNVAGTGDVSIALTGGEGQAVLSPVDPGADLDHRYVVMPMRT